MEASITLKKVGKLIHDKTILAGLKENFVQEIDEASYRKHIKLN